MTVKLDHIITGLGTGGAEMVLYRLLGALDHTRFDCRVICLGGEGVLSEMIRALGVPVIYLNLPAFGAGGLARSLGGVLRLAGLLRQRPPDAIQTWMYHADLLGGLAARLAGAAPVVWGIRNTHVDPKFMKRSTVLTVRACALLSRWLPQRIVCCSQASCREHVAFGYAASKTQVIPNGFDLARFRPDPAARAEVRAELGLGADTRLVGLVARFDPIKDHHNFVQAAQIFHDAHPAVHFLLCGSGVTGENESLVQWIGSGSLRERMHLLGQRQDVTRLMAALDIATNASRGEAFPNVVGEAMACGVPCAVTDVGDSALIVGDTGRVVPACDPRGLAAAWDELLALDEAARMQLGQRARQRVLENFNLPDMARRYMEVYEAVLKKGKP
jgi:glycosyltransferase involved in cell wall biosynthesis